MVPLDLSSSSSTTVFSVEQFLRRVATVSPGRKYASRVGDGAGGPHKAEPTRGGHDNRNAAAIPGLTRDADGLWNRVRSSNIEVV